MPSSRGVSRCNFSDVPSCRFFLFVLLVWNCFDSGRTDDRRDRDMRDLLSGGASVHWDSYTPASICVLARLRTRVPSPVRCGLRCVGELYAAGVFADSIRCVAFDSLCAEPAARAAIISKPVKGGRPRENSRIQKRFDGIVFICAFLVDCGRIICHPAIKMIHKRRTGLAGLVLEQSAGHCSGDQSESAYNAILNKWAARQSFAVNRCDRLANQTAQYRLAGSPRLVCPWFYRE
jgi:hypothetical protein